MKKLMFFPKNENVQKIKKIENYCLVFNFKIISYIISITYFLDFFICLYILSLIII